MNDDFSAGFDRYLPFRAKAVAKKLAGTQYAVIEVTGYRIYDGRYGNERERLDSP